MRVVLTGGSGFIGSSLIEYLLEHESEIEELYNIDCLTYAGNIKNNDLVKDHPKYHFEKIDIRNERNVEYFFREIKPTHVFHLAAESHVDKSLDSFYAPEFIQTNTEGTLYLLESSLRNKAERFLMVSTDETMGEIHTGSFDELAPYHPNNPYASSKAAAEHLTNNFFRNFNLNVCISRCTNNFGPRQTPEKLIPHAIKNLLNDKPICIHGNGSNTRSYVFVEDHCQALHKIMQNGTAGMTYHVPGVVEKTNLEIAHLLCEQLDKEPTKYIQHVEDRPGNDARYSLKSLYIDQLGYTPEFSFEEGMKLTIDYYKNKFKGPQQLTKA